MGQLYAILGGGGVFTLYLNTARFSSKKKREKRRISLTGTKKVMFLYPASEGSLERRKERESLLILARLR